MLTCAWSFYNSSHHFFCNREHLSLFILHCQMVSFQGKLNFTFGIGIYRLPSPHYSSPVWQECLKIIWSTIRAPVFGRHQFFGTSKQYRKAHGSLLSGWVNYNYTACCWFPTSSNSLIVPSQLWQIRFESCWLHCSKCQILVLLRYLQHDMNCLLTINFMFIL